MQRNNSKAASHLKRWTKRCDGACQAAARVLARARVPAARFWAEPIEERFAKVGTYEIYRVESNFSEALGAIAVHGIFVRVPIVPVVVFAAKRIEHRLHLDIAPAPLL
jgi:hypothetical protein